MKQIAFTIIFSTLFLQIVIAQNNKVSKLLIPEKAGMMKPNTGSHPALQQAVTLTDYKIQPLPNPLLHLNDQPVLSLPGKAFKMVSLFTELSFSDIFENSMSGIKDDLINSYDDHIPELFNDAPSLLRFKCLIRL